MSVLFFSEIGEMMASSTTFCFSFPFLSTVLIVGTRGFLVSSKSSLGLLTFSLGASDFLGNGPMILDYMVLVLDLLRPVNSRIS